MNAQRGTLLLVPQWRRITSFVFYIFDFTTHEKFMGNVVLLLGYEN